MEVVDQITIAVSIGVSNLRFPRQIVTLEVQLTSTVAIVGVAVDNHRVRNLIRTIRGEVGVGVDPEEHGLVVQAIKLLVTLNGDHKVSITHHLEIRQVARNLNTVDVVQIHHHLRLIADGREWCPRLPRVNQPEKFWMNLSNPVNVKQVSAVWQHDGLPFHINQTSLTVRPSDVSQAVDVLIVLIGSTPDIVQCVLNQVIRHSEPR
ncbi:hypothetical protein D3C71_1317420 [compost metagenome]